MVFANQLRSEDAETRAPMAIAVAAGMFTSTLLTLVIVPAFYVALDDLASGGKARVRRLLGRSPLPADLHQTEQPT